MDVHVEEDCTRSRLTYAEKEGVQWREKGREGMVGGQREGKGQCTKARKLFLHKAFCRDRHRKITHVICHVGFV